MFTDYFNHNTTRRVTAVFGSLFNDIKVKKDSKLITVPLNYGPGSKDFTVNEENNLLDGVKVAMSLPRISYIYLGPQYDSTRQGNKAHLIEGTNGTQLNRVPYNYLYEVKIKTKHISEMNQIVEQIIPWFTPFITVNAVDNVDLGITTDLKVRLDSVSPLDEYTGDLMGKRILETTLSFVVEGFAYRPTSPSAPTTQVVVTIENDVTKQIEEDLLVT